MERVARFLSESTDTAIRWIAQSIPYNRRGGSVAKTKTKTSTTSLETVDQRLIKAIGHPVRAHALKVLNERTASPNELAKELGEGLSQVSYHVKILLESDCIELVKTEPRRGAVEHFYRATASAFLDDNEWAKLPETIQKSMSAKLVQSIFTEAAEALETGSFDSREERHVSWVPMRVDERGWQEIADATMDALQRIMAIRARAGERLEKRGEKGFRVSVSALSFVAPEE